MINFKPLNLVLFSMLLSSALGSTLCAQRVTRTYQPPAPIQNGQIINGPIIQGQRVIRGPVVQGQVIPGQVIQGQPIIQGPVIQGRPIRGKIAGPQQGTPPVNKDQQKALTAARAKIKEQAEAIKALTNQNKRLNRVEETNDAMRKEYARLKQAYEDASKERDKLKINQSISAAQATASDAQQQRMDQLNAQYQEVAGKNRAMADQVQLLTQENADIKSRLKDLQSAGGDMLSLQAEMNEANTRITEVQQQNQTLTDDNNRLQELLQTATSENENLKTRFSTLTQESDQLRSEYLAATKTTTALDQRVRELSSQNQQYLTTLNTRVVSAPAQAKVVPRRSTALAADRDQALALNADLENEKALLMEQISDLEAKIESLQKPAAPKQSALAAVVPSVPGDGASNFNILNWIIPFLVIGLTIGIYVFLTEENGEDIANTPTAAAAEHDNDADRR